MINAIETYAEAGKAEAKARNERDEARANFHRQHFGRMMALEKPDDAKAAKLAYYDAYGAARRAPKFEPFR